MITRSLLKPVAQRVDCPWILKNKNREILRAEQIAQFSVSFIGAYNKNPRDYQFQSKLFYAGLGAVVLVGTLCKKALCEEVDEGVIGDELLIKAKTYIDSLAYTELSQASAGKSTVFLHNDFVLKIDNTGSSEEINDKRRQNRLEETKKIYNFCNANSYNHLIVPRVGLYRHFIVEERLPIRASHAKEYMNLYLEEYEKFTEAVKEFTELLFQTTGWDLTGGRSKYSNISEIPGRYDNIPLYIDKGKGCIGLVDLEGIRPSSEWASGYSPFQAAKLAIFLFPLHFEEIITVLLKKDPNIQNYSKQLQAIRDRSLGVFDMVARRHAEFIKRKQITIDNPFRFDRLTQEREKQLLTAFRRKLIEWNEKGHPELIEDLKGCLGENAEQSLSEFSQKVFPVALEGLYGIINHHLVCNLKEKGEITRSWELPELRSLDIPYNGGEDFERSIRFQLDKLSILELHSSTFRKDGVSSPHCMTVAILDVLLNELQEGGEICLYKDSGRCCYLVFC